MLVHYPIDDICLPIFENIYILIIVLLCLFYLFMYFSFLFSFFLNIYIFLEDQIGNKCTIVWFNVSVSSVNIIYMRISLFAYALYTNSLMCMY